MKKIILIFAVFFLCNRLHAQEQLNISQAIAYRVTCHEHGNLEGGQYVDNDWMDIFGQKLLGQEYLTAKKSNDEFKLHRIKKILYDKYEEARKTIDAGSTIYYVTELIYSYSYDFSTSSVKMNFNTFNKEEYLDAYEETGGHIVSLDNRTHNSGQDNFFDTERAPKFRIKNYENIPSLFEMPFDIADKSFASRKGANKPAFKLRYYFKFEKCGGYSDVDVVKVELIDEIVNYKKSYEIEHYEQPNNTENNTSSNNNDSNTNNNESNNNQQTNSDGKTKNTIYNSEDIKLLEGLIDLSRIEYAEKDYFIGEFKESSNKKKGKLRFEESKEFNDLLVNLYTPKEGKKEVKRSYMYYKGLLFCRESNTIFVIRKFQNGIGWKTYLITMRGLDLEEDYYEK